MSLTQYPGLTEPVGVADVFVAEHMAWYRPPVIPALPEHQVDLGWFVQPLEPSLWTDWAIEWLQPLSTPVPPDHQTDEGATLVIFDPILPDLFLEWYRETSVPVFPVPIETVGTSVEPLLIRKLIYIIRHGTMLGGGGLPGAAEMSRRGAIPA